MIKYTTIGQNILIIDKYFKLYLKKSLKKYDINTAEGMTLLVLYGENGNGNSSKTLMQLIEELQYDKGVMTRTMQSLEQNGYVIRQENPLDSRSYIFKLTQKGIDFKPILIDILQIWSEEVFSEIDDLLVDVIDKILDKMANNAKNSLE